MKQQVAYSFCLINPKLEAKEASNPKHQWVQRKTKTKHHKQPKKSLLSLVRKGNDQEREAQQLRKILDNNCSMPAKQKKPCLHPVLTRPEREPTDAIVSGVRDGWDFHPTGWLPGPHTPWCQRRPCRVPAPHLHLAVMRHLSSSSGLVSVESQWKVRTSTTAHQ